MTQNASRTRRSRRVAASPQIHIPHSSWNRVERVPESAAPCEQKLAKSQNDQQYPCQNAPRNKRRFRNENNGEPGWIRTSDQQLRRLLLYPSELRARERRRSALACLKIQCVHCPRREYLKLSE